MLARTSYIIYTDREKFEWLNHSRIDLSRIQYRPLSSSHPLYTLYSAEESLIDTIEILFTFNFAIARNGRLPWQCNNNAGSVTIDSLHCSILFDSFIRSTY